MPKIDKISFAEQNIIVKIGIVRKKIHLDITFKILFNIFKLFFENISAAIGEYIELTAINIMLNGKITIDTAL